MGIHLERAKTLYRNSQYTEAERELQQELENTPNCVISRLLLSNCLLGLKRHQAALQESEKAANLVTKHIVLSTSGLNSPY